MPTTLNGNRELTDKVGGDRWEGCGDFRVQGIPFSPDPLEIAKSERISKTDGNPARELKFFSCRLRNYSECNWMPTDGTVA